MFRAAAEAHEGDVLKMYNVRGSLIGIGPSLPANTAETRYRLEVIAVGTSGSIVPLFADFTFAGFVFIFAISLCVKFARVANGTNNYLNRIRRSQRICVQLDTGQALSTVQML